MSSSPSIIIPSTFNIIQTAYNPWDITRVFWRPLFRIHSVIVWIYFLVICGVLKLLLLIIYIYIYIFIYIWVTHDASRIAVFSSGIYIGLNGAIPVGGHVDPSSIVGDSLLWKNLPNN
jgi:hypothetical protein